VVVQAILLVPVLAVLLSLRQEPLYESSAHVLISRQNVAALLSGTQDPTQYISPERVIDTQARLARVRSVARRALATAGITDRSADELLARSTVSADASADLLVSGSPTSFRTSPGDWRRRMHEPSRSTAASSTRPR